MYTGAAYKTADADFTKHDRGNCPLYRVGQEVETYTTPFRLSTRRRKIAEVRLGNGSLFGGSFFWVYRLECGSGDDPAKQWVCADDIQSAC